MKNIKENCMLRNVIPIQALTEENSTHELFCFCFVLNLVRRQHKY